MTRGAETFYAMYADRDGRELAFVGVPASTLGDALDKLAGRGIPDGAWQLFLTTTDDPVTKASAEAAQAFDGWQP